MEKNENQSNQKLMIFFYEGKSALNHFDFNKPSSGLSNGETSIDKIIMDV